MSTENKAEPLTTYITFMHGYAFTLCCKRMIWYVSGWLGLYRRSCPGCGAKIMRGQKPLTQPDHE